MLYFYFSPFQIKSNGNVFKFLFSNIGSLYSRRKGISQKFGTYSVLASTIIATS